MGFSTFFTWDHGVFHKVFLCSKLVGGANCAPGLVRGLGLNCLTPRDRAARARCMEIFNGNLRGKPAWQRRARAMRWFCHSQKHSTVYYCSKKKFFARPFDRIIFNTAFLGLSKTNVSLNFLAFYNIYVGKMDLRVRRSEKTIIKQFLPNSLCMCAPPATQGCPPSL